VIKTKISRKRTVMGKTLWVNHGNTIMTDFPGVPQQCEFDSFKCNNLA